MHPVTVFIERFRQLLVFLSDLAVLLFKIVFMQMCILLYYWANTMMMIQAVV